MPEFFAKALRFVLPPIGVVALLLGVLEGLKRAGFLPITVPAPSEVGEAFTNSAGDLFYHAGPTLLSAGVGFCLATFLALAMGALAVTWRRLEPGILRLGILVDSIPLIALTPVLTLWVGNGLAPRIVLATLAALFPLLVGAVQGFKAIDRNTADLFHVLAANRAQVLRKLALPSALPYLFAGLKVAAPLSILGALIAEWIGAERGLGIMMTYALFSFDVPLAWLTIVAVCVVAMSAYALVAIAERLTIGPPPDFFGGRAGSLLG